MNDQPPQEGRISIFSFFVSPCKASEGYHVNLWCNAKCFGGETCGRWMLLDSTNLIAFNGWMQLWYRATVAL